MLDKSSAAVIIPVYNEEKTISAVVRALSELGLKVIVIDDGSTDRSAELAQEAGAFLVKQPCNMGYEVALDAGFNEALKQGFGRILTFDGDGQFDPLDVKKLLDCQDQSGVDLVIGVRDFRNRKVELLLSIFGRCRFGVKDPLCGLKLYLTSSSAPFLPFDTLRLVGMQLAFTMIQHGCNFKQCCVRVNKREGASRFGTLLKGEIRILRALFFSIRKFGLFPNGN